MHENNTDTNNLPKNNDKHSNEKKHSNFFAEHKAEFKKITWPSKKVLVKQTITVIFISIIVGIIIYGYDFIIDFILQKLISIV